MYNGVSVPVGPYLIQMCVEGHAKAGKRGLQRWQRSGGHGTPPTTTHQNVYYYFFLSLQCRDNIQITTVYHYSERALYGGSCCVLIVLFCDGTVL